jgi:lipopolysaccharide export LptBFGC system permease protein LptF
MRRPGLRVRALCQRICSERAMRRLIDPAVADLQAEYADARSSGSRWRATWALCAGYIAVAKVLGIAGWGELGDALHSWEPAERAAARRGARVACAAVVGLTVLLMLPIFISLNESLSPTLALYLVPSTLALSLPFGCALGIAWAFNGAMRRRKLAVCALALAFICSAAMVANIAWLVPEANQSFRQHVFARMQPSPGAPSILVRGDNELSWTASRQRRTELAAAPFGDHRLRRFDAGYYRKWGLTGATFAIVALVLALGARRRRTRGGLTIVALGSCATYYSLLMSASAAASAGVIPAIVAGWSANAVCVVAALLLAFSPRPRHAAAP